MVFTLFCGNLYKSIYYLNCENADGQKVYTLPRAAFLYSEIVNNGGC